MLLEAAETVLGYFGFDRTYTYTEIIDEARSSGIGKGRII
jgi:hypothetical protein